METKRKIGGVLLLAASAELGKDSLSWAIGKGLDAGKGPSWKVIAELPWHSITASVLAVAGVAVLSWPTGEKEAVAAPPTRTDRLHEFHVRAAMIVERVRASRQTPFYRRQSGDHITDIVRDGLSLLIFFGKEGVATPSFQTTSAEKACVGLVAYFEVLWPLLRDRHIEQVDAMAQTAASQAEIACQAFKPENWYVESY